WWASRTTTAPMVRATKTSTRAKPRRSRTISQLPPIHDRDEVLHLRRLRLRQRDAIEGPLGPLDTGDELADRIAAQPAVELVALEEGERREHPLFHGKHAFALPCVPLGAEAPGHEVEQHEPGARYDRERDERLEQRDPAVTSEHREALR